MNTYLTKLMMYHEIHRMKREGHTLSQISRAIVKNRRTVRRYLSLSEPEFDLFMEQQSERKKELLAYETFVKSKLELYPDTSAAQMHDWLKEHFADLPAVTPKTVFNFVSWVRIKHSLPKISPARQFEIVDQLPYGRQAQADFGEYNMRNNLGKRVKVFFFTLVLSRSRYKYVWFSERHFTTETAIQAHEQAFAYISGIPLEIVYDQDKLFLAQENHGDMILTDEFRAYTRGRSFQLHFCRKSDPQSKGKIENVVKYVKQNFLYNRLFEDIQTLNDAVLGWLGRTANFLVHNSTRLAPHSEWSKEQSFLAPYFALLPQIKHHTHAVRKDNTICWKSNFYSLPLNTYKGPGTVVVVRTEGSDLIIADTESKQICRHPLAVGKGQIIKNSDHRRDKKPAIEELINQLCLLLNNPEQGRQFFNAIHQAKPRYIRDQLLILKQTILESQRSIVERAIEYCCANNITSATDCKDIVAKYSKPVVCMHEAKLLHMNPLNGDMPKAASIQPAQSTIEVYQTIITNQQL